MHCDPVKSFLKQLQDPNDVGMTEYRLVHELLHEIAENGELLDDDPLEVLELMVASLDELRDEVKITRRELRTHIRGVRHLRKARAKLATGDT